ncbi:MAG: acyl-CoA dehydrogenase family protein, partial [Rubrobacteraceae bacterium]
MTVTPEGTRQGTRPVDFVNVGSLLSEEESGVRDRVRAFVDEHVVPVAAGYWDRAEFPFELLPGLGELGIMGGTIGK